MCKSIGADLGSCDPSWTQVTDDAVHCSLCRQTAGCWLGVGVKLDSGADFLFFSLHPSLKVGLRQLDMSLLCQLYSLYESIQEYKGACQAAASPDCPYALENGFFDEEEEEDFREQASLHEGRARGLPGDLLLSVSSLSSSDWILKST